MVIATIIMVVILVLLVLRERQYPGQEKVADGEAPPSGRPSASTLHCREQEQEPEREQELLQPLPFLDQTGQWIFYLTEDEGMGQEIWWSNEGSGKFFFADLEKAADKGWVSCRTPRSGRKWLCNEESGACFFEAS